MREDIARIMRLVQEGKLSPEDAAELLDAMQHSPMEEPVSAGATGTIPPPPPPPPVDKGFAGFFEAIEKIGKDVTSGINWTEVGDQLRKGVNQGAEAVKKAASEFKDGKINFGFFETESRRLEQPLLVPAGKVLRIESASGDIKVNTGMPGEGKVVATAMFRGDDREHLRAKAEVFALVVEESDHYVMIRQPDQSGLSVDFEITLPEAVPVEIKGTSGDIQISGAKGANRINAASGDITLTKIHGSLEIDTASGDVTLSDSELSMLTLENKSGDVKLTNVHGAITIRTASGDVKLEKCGGKSLAVDGVSGDMVIDLDQPLNGAANLRTVNGLISIEIPGGSNCRMQLSAVRGEVMCSVPLEEEARQERRITGRVGDGSGSLDASAVNGDIHVRLRES